jgi:hypothetical protein
MSRDIVDRCPETSLALRACFRVSFRIGREESGRTPAWKNTPAKCAVVIVATWLIVGIPLAYGVFNAVKAALQLFS